MTTDITSQFRPICWKDGKVSLIDQTILPDKEVWVTTSDYRVVVRAIKDMQIRGAPAIGVAGAYALALAAVEYCKDRNFEERLVKAADEIGKARPTGANLSWAVKRMMEVAKKGGSSADVVKLLIAEAQRIQDEDVEANIRMGRFGAELLPQNGAVMTHCNAGALATGGFGTAVGVIHTAWTGKKISHVYATETRPFLQGARLTAWELMQANIDATLLPDSAAGQLMRRGEVQAVVVGADRIAANGDVANKIGTYSLAVLAKENGVPFYVAAPRSTIDMGLSSGDDIEIEERPSEEVTHLNNKRIPPEGIGIINTAFDVTPSKYVTAIITEAGVVQKPYTEGLPRIMGE